MPEAYVVSAENLPEESWNDPGKGVIAWRTMFSADRHPSNALTGGVAKLEPGAALLEHRHDPAEIYFIIEGRGVVVIDGVDRTVQAGDGVFIPSNALHGLRAAADSPLKMFYMLAADSFAEIEYRFG
jgi:quercetin dioxygenase-like cupin family protein